MPTVNGDRRRRRPGWRAACVVAVAAAVPGTAAAQTGRFDLSFGGLWTGGYGLGPQRAIETRNQVGGGELVLFETDSDVTGGAGLEARFGVRLGSAFTIEAGGSWTRASIATRVSGDFEGAPPLDVGSDFSQYVLDGALVYRLGRLALAGGRLVPFVEGGAGYLRQLHEDGVLVETGTVIHGGGGIHLWLRSGSGGWFDRVGLRVDARVTSRSGGVDVADDTRRTFGALGAGLAVGF